MSERANKRQKTSPSTNATTSASLADIPTREALIARLLNERAQTTGLPKGPIIQDLSAPPVPSMSRPSFELPDLTSSSSLLSRVQNFLPQLQQANASIQEGNGSGGFQLINQDEEGLDQEAEEDERTRTREAEEEDMDPQIVMNLALGVMEEKIGSTDSSEDQESSNDSSEEVLAAEDGSDSASDSSSSGSDEEEGDEDEDEDEDEEVGEGVAVAPSIEEVSQAQPHSSAPGKKRKSLIEELN